eukprot:1638193-Pyramimonas_sp.AAC.1
MDLSNGAGDFWLVSHANDAAQPSLATGRECGRMAEERGKGHALGPPHERVAVSFVEGLIEEMTNEAASFPEHIGA